MKKLNRIYLLSAATVFMCLAGSANAQIPFPFYCYPAPVCPTFGLTHNVTTVVNNGLETKDQVVQAVNLGDISKFGDLKAVKDKYNKKPQNSVTGDVEKPVEGTKAIATCRGIDPEEIETVKEKMYELFMQYPANDDMNRKNYRAKAELFYEDSLMEIYAAAINLDKMLKDIEPAIKSLAEQMQNGIGGAESGEDINGSWNNIRSAYDTLDKLTKIWEEVTVLKAQYESSRAILGGLKPKDAPDDIAPQSRATFRNEETISFAQVKVSSDSRPKKAPRPVGTVTFAPMDAGLKSPYAGSEADLKAINDLQPLYINLTRAVEAHNLIISLPDYKGIFEEYHRYQCLHMVAMKTVETSDQCVLQHIGRYYEAPNRVWLGTDSAGSGGYPWGQDFDLNKCMDYVKQNSSLTPPDYSSRGGLSKWAINSLEIAKAKEATIDEKGLGTVDSSGGETDTSGTISAPAADVLKAPANTPKGVINPDKSKEIASINKDANRLAWRIGAEASKILTKDQYSTVPSWGKVVNKYPIWTDQKRLYSQYIEGKYANIADYVANLDVRSSILEMALGLNTKVADPDVRMDSREEMENYRDKTLQSIFEADAAKIDAAESQYDGIYQVRENRVKAIAAAEISAKTQLQNLHDKKETLEANLKTAMNELTELNNSLSNITEELKKERETANSQETGLKEVNERYQDSESTYTSVTYGKETQPEKEKKVETGESVTIGKEQATIKLLNPDELLVDGKAPTKNTITSQPSSPPSVAPTPQVVTPEKTIAPEEEENVEPESNSGFRSSPVVGPQSSLRIADVLGFAQYGTATIEYDVQDVDYEEAKEKEETKAREVVKEKENDLNISSNIDTSAASAEIARIRELERQAQAKTNQVRNEAKNKERLIENLQKEIKNVETQIEAQVGIRISLLNSTDKTETQKVIAKEEELKALQARIRDGIQTITNLYAIRAGKLKDYYNGQASSAVASRSTPAAWAYAETESHELYDPILAKIATVYTKQYQELTDATQVSSKSTLVAMLSLQRDYMKQDLTETYDAKISEATFKGDTVSINDLSNMKTSRLAAADANYNVKYAEATKEADELEVITEAELFQRNKNSVLNKLYDERVSAIKGRAQSKINMIDNVVALITKSESYADEIKANVEKIVEKYKEEIFKIEDDSKNLYLPNGHPKVVEVHGKLMDELQSISLTQEVAPLLLSANSGETLVLNAASLLFKKALLAKACKDNDKGVSQCKEADDKLFIGVVSRDKDLKAPREPMPYYLPPLREFIYFDKTDIITLPQTVEGDIWGMDFIELNDEVPEIWKELLAKDTFIEKDVNLEEILDTSVAPNLPKPPKWMPKKLAQRFLTAIPANTVEGFRFINGGIYPCTLGNYTIAISALTRKYIIGSKSPQSIYPECTQIRIKKSSRPLASDTFEIIDIAEDVKDSAVVNLGASDANLAKLLNVQLDLEEGSTIESNSSELGTFLQLSEKGMKLNEVPLFVSNKMKEITKNLEQEGSKYKTNVPDEIVKKSLFENNQVGNFLTFVDGEQSVRKSMEEIKISVDNTRNLLLEALKVVPCDGKGSIVPDSGIDLSKADDYIGAKKKLKEIRDGCMSVVKSGINSVNISSDNEIASDKKKSMEIVLRALDADNFDPRTEEPVLNVSPTMRDMSSGELQEQIRSGKANKGASGKYEEEANKEMTKRIGGYPKPYCAAY